MKKVKLHHDRVNFVYSTDWHISATPPGRREDDYQTAIMNKIEFVRDLVLKFNGVGLCGGDVFHIKNPKSPANSLSLISSLIQLLKQFPVYGTVGNHDVSYDKLDTLPTQPLGVLIAAGVYTNLNDEPVLFTNENETVRVLVETFPYEHHGAAALQRLLNTGTRPEGVTHRIGIVHAYGEPGNGGGMYGEAIGYNQIEHLDYDFLLWGHDHSRHETVEVGKVTHVNLGSVARAAYASDEANRPVIATIISFAEDGIRYKEKEIPVTPLKIAFKSADKPVQDVVKSEELKEFFAALNDQVEAIESADPREVLKSLCPENEPKLQSLVLELCEL